MKSCSKVYLFVALFLFGCDDLRHAEEERRANLYSSLSQEEQRVLLHFEELTFDDGSGDRKYGSDKWLRDNIVYAVANNDNPEYLQDVRELFDQAEQLTGIEFSDNSSVYGVRDWGGTQIIIHNTTRWEAADEDYAMQLRMFAGENSDAISISDAQTPKDRCVGLVHDVKGKNDETMKYKAMIFIGWDNKNEYGPSQRECLHLNFMKVLGFEGRAHNAQSVTNDYEHTEHLSDYDELALQILYSPNVESGGPKNSVLRQAREAIRELNLDSLQ